MLKVLDHGTVLYHEVGNGSGNPHHIHLNGVNDMTLLSGVYTTRNLSTCSRVIQIETKWLFCTFT